MVVGARRIRNEKLREHQYKEGYTRSLEEKRFEHMGEKVKWAIVRSGREVCSSVRVGRKNLKNLWWNDEVKAAVKRKELFGS